jgi:hypothetical protein
MHLRSIEYGLELLKKGIRSGAKVQIWRDPWLPKPPRMKPSLKKGRSRLWWVLQFMKPGRCEWDEQECLYPHDAEEVLKVRLTEREEDFIAWHFDRSGVFTIKSAYRLAVDSDWRQAWGRH